VWVDGDTSLAHRVLGFLLGAPVFW
jgi:hypothetical protein